MKNKKFAIMAAIAGLTVGGLSAASVASAQSYGSDQTAPQSETSTDNTVEDGGAIDDLTVQVQETDTEESDTEGDVDGERRGRRGHRGGCNLEAAAEAIGVDEADLRSAVQDGQSIADVAEANGVEVDVVVDAMVEAKADRIAEKVAEGRITQDEADEKLAELEGRITDRVNGVAAVRA